MEERKKNNWLAGLALFLSAVAFSAYFSASDHVTLTEIPASNEGGISASSLSTSGQAVFQGSFGEQFRYKAPLTLRHDPYGRLDRVDFLWEGSQIGGLSLNALPPPGNAKVLADVVADDLRNRFGGTSIEYTRQKNAAGCDFYQFRADVQRQQDRYIYFILLYIDPHQTAKDRESALRSRFGTYKFEFVVPQAKFEAIRPHLQLVLDSFTPPDFGAEK